MTDHSHAALPEATQDDWRFDLGLAALGVGLVHLPYLVMSSVFQQLSPFAWKAAAVTGFGMFASLVLRRHQPMAMMLIAGVFAAFQVALVPLPTASVIVVPLIAYTIARLIPGIESRAVVLLGAVGAVAAPLRWILFTYGWNVASLLVTVLASMVCMGLVITPYALGRRSLDLAEASREKELAEAERFRMLVAQAEHETRAAEAAVRAQIARELHDIVAHSVSVMVVQAEGGRAMAAKKPEAAAEVLSVIADTGREALGEMRRIVGVLRDGPEPADYAPAPGFADIPGMVAKTGAELTITGSPSTNATVGLTAYRVVQEALTNVLKHAGAGAQPNVRIEYSPDGVDITVLDSGLGEKAPNDGRGHGIRGMAERVTSLGGTLVAGPRPEGGFEVRAHVPAGTLNKEIV